MTNEKTAKQFIAKSAVYDKLKERIDACVSLIQDSIKNRKPILIRHHADCDGYAGAVALERAILDLLYKFHKRESDIFYFYRRTPSKAPFYDYSDATKDVSNFLQDVMRHEHKTPLIIVIDNGSSKEDLLSLKKLKVYGADIIVIDHHPTFTENDAYIDVHINPHIVGSSSEISAGMLCAEIAGFLNQEVDDMDLLAALSGVADKCEGKELDQYLKHAEAKGYTKEMILDIGECIDFETYYLGFLESRYMVDDLFFGDLAKQKNLLAIIRSEIEERKKVAMLAVEKFVEVEQTQKCFVIAKLDVDRIGFQGEYPKRGKTVGLALAHVRQKYNQPAVAIGYGCDFITLRCDKEVDADLNKILAILHEKLPYGMIQGGGHAKAGTVRFVEAVRDEAMQIFLGCLRDAKRV
jgi:archaea-specific RecJ-like exonuclease